MSGSIGRSYLIQAWNDASSYSGEMIGQRLKQSTDLYLANGKANIGLFEERPVVKKKKSVADSIDLAQRHFDRLEQMSIDLDNEYFDGEIDQTRYELLRYKLDKRLLAAWSRLEKENAPIWQKEDEKFLENSLTFSLDEVECKTSLGNQLKSLFSRVKSDDKSLIKGKGCVSMALKDCSKNNVFLIGYCTVMNIANKLKEVF